MRFRRIFQHVLPALGLALVAIAPSSQAAPDLSFTLENTDTPPGVYTGSEYQVNFRFSNGGDGSPVTFEAGEALFAVDFPTELGEPFSRGFGAQNVAGFGNIGCAGSGQRLTCSASGPVTLNAAGSFFQATIGFVPVAPGSVRVPVAGGECSADPGNVIVEENESNNDCTGFDFEVFAAPAVDDEWLQVTMWDNLMRSYDRVADDYVDAVPTDESDGTPLHTLNDLVRDPLTGDLYVFHRRYQSGTQRLGRYTPGGAVEDIADTGSFFHDSAFAPDGTLYAVGHDGRLYTIDLATAVPTAQCDTGNGAPNSVHSALAFDPFNGTLVQIADGTRFDIDPQALPGDGAVQCPSTSVAIAAAVDLDPASFVAFFADGVVQVVDYTGDWRYVDAAGGGGQLGRLPQTVHGMVPEAVAPAPATDCVAPYYALSDFEDTSLAQRSLLFALDDTGDASFVMTLPEGDAGAMEWDPLRKRLQIFGDGSRGDRLLEVDPCAAVIGRDRVGSVRTRALDINPFGVAHAFNPSTGALIRYDIETQTATPIGGPPPFAYSLAITGGEVHLSTASTDRTDALEVHALAGYPSLQRTVALDFEPGLEASSGFDWNRFIGAMTPDRFAPSELLATLHRVYPTRAGRRTTARQSAFVRIDPAGNVSLEFLLPSSFQQVVPTFAPLFADGFEDPFAPR